ncbi:MAG: DUF835 domain-containing protein [Thermoplasmata archaeon]|nr:DUF835 domain-containing protein [Thermoplasmata archaeon]
MNLDDVQWAYPLMGVIIVEVILGILILVKNPKHRTNQLGAAVQFTVALWILGDVGLKYAADYSTAQAWSTFLWIGAVFIPSTVLHFVALFIRALPQNKMKYLWAIHLVSVLLYPLIILEQLDLGLADAPYEGIWATNSEGLVYSLFAVYLISCVYIGLFILWRGFVKIKNKIERSQVLYLAIGMTVAGIFGPLFSVILPILEYDINVSGGIFPFIMVAFFGYAMLKYKLFDIEHIIEEAKPVTESLRLKPGMSYIIKESGSNNSYEIFRGMVSQTPGLCITSFYPQKLRNEYNLEKTPIVWITETSTDEKKLSPHRLEFEILYTIETFMKDGENTTVMIDDLKYLSMVNGFDKTLEFLKSINDVAAMNNAAIIIPVNPSRFEEREIFQLKSIFDEMIDLGRGESKIPARDDISSYSFIFEEESPVQASEILRSSQSKKLCITSQYPSKLKTRFDLPKMDMYWLTTTRQSEERTLQPNRLEFEITQTIAEFLRKEKGLVFIYGLETLLMESGLPKVNDFLKTIIDIASVSEGSIMASIDPGSLKEREMAVLESRFDIVRRIDTS